MLRSISIGALMLFATHAFAAVADFEDLSLPPNSFYNGSDSAGGFNSGGAHFPNAYDTLFGSWAGFAYSNVNDTTTAGFFNQYAAVTGTGVGGNGIYGVAYDGGPVFGIPVKITLPYTAQMQGLHITNTTYAYRAMHDGDDGGFNFARQFGDDPGTPTIHGNEGFPDLAQVTIVAEDYAGNTTSPILFTLADYTGATADDYVVNDWRFVDLSSLGWIKSLTFTVSSTDFGTPTYFALDNVTFVPEPGSLLVIGLVASLALHGRTRSMRA